MRVIGVGLPQVNYRSGKLLSDGMRICPKSFKNGFSIVCDGPLSSPVLFYVDNKMIRKEQVHPYFIAGDSGGFRRAWRNYLTDRWISVRCSGSNGTEASVKIRITCRGVVDRNSGSQKNGSAKKEKETTKPTPQKRGNVPSAVPEDKRIGCVVIDARSTQLSSGWTKAKDGVWFRKDVNSNSIVRPGMHTLSYKFKAPNTATYGFVIDMTTSHRVDHNDVWARFVDGGFRMNRQGSFKGNGSSGRDWIKVYHNSNKRDLKSKTIDHHGHSLSTRKVLRAGSFYGIELSGRSSKVLVHRIILFPCKGTSCWSGSQDWRSRLSKCATA